MCRAGCRAWGWRLTGAELRQWRTVRRVSRAMLADAAGVGVHTVERWETSKRPPWWVDVVLATPEFAGRLMRAVERHHGRSNAQQIMRAIGAQVASGGR